jgi:hypothetical protein
LFDLNPEIERTFHSRRRQNLVNISSSPIDECNSITGDSDSDSLHSFSLQNLFDSESVFDNNMAEQTLRQLAAPDVNYNGLCIEYADVAVHFELKSGLIHLLPRFSGLAVRIHISI